MFRVNKCSKFQDTRDSLKAELQSPIPSASRRLLLPPHARDRGADGEARGQASGVWGPMTRQAPTMGSELRGQPPPPPTSATVSPQLERHSLQRRLRPSPPRGGKGLPLAARSVSVGSPPGPAPPSPGHSPLQKEARPPSQAVAQAQKSDGCRPEWASGHNLPRGGAGSIFLMLSKQRGPLSDSCRSARWLLTVATCKPHESTSPSRGRPPTFRGIPHRCGQTRPASPRHSRTDAGPLALHMDRVAGNPSWPAAYRSALPPQSKCPPHTHTIRGTRRPGTGSAVSPTLGNLRVPPVRARAIPGPQSPMVLGELPGQQSVRVRASVFRKLAADWCRSAGREREEGPSPGGAGAPREP